MPGNSFEGLDYLLQRISNTRTQIECFACTLRLQQLPVHVNDGAHIGKIPDHVYRAQLDRLRTPPETIDDFRYNKSGSLSNTSVVERPNDRNRQPPLPKASEVLHCELGDPVVIDGQRWLAFVDNYLARMAVDAGTTCQQDRIRTAPRFDQSSQQTSRTKNIRLVNPVHVLVYRRRNCSKMHDSVRSLDGQNVDEPLPIQQIARMRRERSSFVKIGHQPANVVAML